MTRFSHRVNFPNVALSKVIVAAESSQKNASSVLCPACTYTPLCSMVHVAFLLKYLDSFFFSIGKDFIFVFILFTKIICVSLHSRSLFFLFFSALLRIPHRQQLSMHIPETPYAEEHPQLIYQYTEIALDTDNF